MQSIQHEKDVGLLLRPELHFISPMGRADREDFIACVQRHVLATDVTSTMPAVRAFVQRGPGSPPSAEQVLHLIIKRSEPLGTRDGRRQQQQRDHEPRHRAIQMR